MDYKERIERLKYYGTTYATGDNLGREIDGTDQLLLDTATAIETLLAERENSRLTPKMVTCPGGWKGMRSTRYYCPHCKKAVRNNEAYCHKCGQAILFPKQEYDKENNKIWLNFEAVERIGPTPPDRQQTER